MSRRAKQRRLRKAARREARIVAVPVEHPKLYFAYGSNLNVEQMMERCPRCLPVAKLTLPDWRLYFSGVLNVERCEGRSTPGALYRVTPSDIAALDVYEGYPRLYGKVEFDVRLNAGNVEEAFLYAIPSAAEYSPSLSYFNVCEQGYRDWRLPLAELERAEDESYEADEEYYRSRFGAHRYDWKDYDWSNPSDDEEAAELERLFAQGDDSLLGIPDFDPTLRSGRSGRRLWEEDEE
jgi:gamma-glutamylcyclotransferase (GGCT)/AIG2-like uncharacterized protein YtfP